MMHAKRAIARLGFALLVATLHCSRPTRAAGATADASAPTVSAHPGDLDATDEGASRAPPHANEPPRTPGAHVILLPYEGHGDTPRPQDGIAPGELPGASFPAGTVYVARYAGDGGYVVEWDLARGTVRRKLKLSLPPREANFRIRRIGDVLHIVAWEFNEDAHYVRVTSNLKQELTWPLGRVSAFGPGAIVGDAEWTLVLARVTPPDTPPAVTDAGGYFAFSFDAAGRFVARRKLEPDASYLFLDANAAVIDGHALVAFELDDEDRIRLVRLGRTLNIERDLRVHKPARDGGMPAIFGALSGSGDRFYVAWIDPPAVTAFALSAQTFGPEIPCHSEGPAWALDRVAWLAGEHIVLDGDDREKWIEWTDAGARRAPDPPCPGLSP
jgi:hypothetical protein